jgi:D-sedoheptulose 7-phosphate isomerase
MKNHTKNYFKGVSEISESLDKVRLEKMVKTLLKIKKKGGRIFFLGVGGSAANASHCVNDFRKLCKIESYCPTDNVAEFSARINDDGWNKSFSSWLEVSKINKKDAIFILSVGGGNLQKKVSINLIEAIKLSKKKETKILGIVGHEGGFTKANGDVVVSIPKSDPKLITPYTEAFQAVIWHYLVSHPSLQEQKTKW